MKMFNRLNPKESLEVMVRIHRIITGEYKTKDAGRTKEYRDKRLVSVADLRGRTNKLVSMNKLARKYPDEHPLDVVLSGLEQDGIIELLDIDPITGKRRDMILADPLLECYISQKELQISDMEQGL